ncbi:hypothetical protein PanWU01x14_283190 [Parasponia andersonii]|uniref:Uncharacterized protein n=1 Tax=Parasponia andersonii TaxID=3476 RepID=A0A2P5B0D2_PARAD|nr:hypothetical protein PanWU01x14_283190 [Parasponia andersonii]
MNKFYRFHRELRHDTSDCRQLKDQIERLFQQSYLRECINKADEQDKQVYALTPHGNASVGEQANPSNNNNGAPHEIRAISGGPTVGDSSNTR